MTSDLGRFRTVCVSKKKKEITIFLLFVSLALRSGEMLVFHLSVPFSALWHFLLAVSHQPEKEEEGEEWRGRSGGGLPFFTRTINTSGRMARRKRGGEVFCNPGRTTDQRKRKTLCVTQTCRPLTCSPSLSAPTDVQ